MVANPGLLVYISRFKLKYKVVVFGKNSNFKSNLSLLFTSVVINYRVYIPFQFQNCILYLKAGPDVFSL